MLVLKPYFPAKNVAYTPSLPHPGLATALWSPPWHAWHFSPMFHVNHLESNLYVTRHCMEAYDRSPTCIFLFCTVNRISTVYVAIFLLYFQTMGVNDFKEMVACFTRVAWAAAAGKLHLVSSSQPIKESSSLVNLHGSSRSRQSSTGKHLKWLNQAKIIKKSEILFCLLNLTIWCKHVHRLELQKLKKNFAVHSPVRLDIETKSTISYIGHAWPK